MTLQTDTKIATRPDAQVKPIRIDTHQHLFPPRYVSENMDAIQAVAPGMPTSISTDWSPQLAIEAMDRFCIGAAILSISTPGVWFGNVERSRSMARYCNEYGAQLMANHRGVSGCSPPSAWRM